jgi:hypothetical protein
LENGKGNEKMKTCSVGIAFVLLIFLTITLLVCTSAQATLIGSSGDIGTFWTRSFSFYPDTVDMWGTPLNPPLPPGPVDVPIGNTITLYGYETAKYPTSHLLLLTETYSQNIFLNTGDILSGWAKYKTSD